jgi:hypothetical protein
MRKSGKMIDNFNKTINVDQSVHKNAYGRIIQDLLSDERSMENKEINIIAQKLLKILEHENPKAKVFCPFRAIIHHWAHKALPVTIQDLILRQKINRIING